MRRDKKKDREGCEEGRGLAGERYGADIVFCELHYRSYLGLEKISVYSLIRKHIGAFVGR